jgi:hypothetical protein
VTAAPQAPCIFCVAGDFLEFGGIVGAHEGGSGKKLRVEQLGSLADLDARIEEFKKAGSDKVLISLPLMYYRSMLNGEGKLAR